MPDLPGHTGSHPAPGIVLQPSDGGVGWGRVADVIVLKALLLLIPISSWALTARRTWIGWVVGSLVAVAAVAELALAMPWIAVEERYTLVVAVAFATALALLVVALVELRRPIRARQGFGLLLAVVYGIVALGMGFMLGFATEPDFRPSAGEVLPLPTGLAVVDNRDDGCDHTSLHNDCGREIRVRSTTGLPDSELLQQLRAYLTQQRGWQLDLTSGDWSGCHEEGRMLDRHEVCVRITSVEGGALMDLDADDYDVPSAGS